MGTFKICENFTFFLEFYRGKMHFLEDRDKVVEVFLLSILPLLPLAKEATVFPLW